MPQPTDWHPADVKAALEKRGYSLARISRELGLKPTTANAVFQKRYPRVQERIGRILDMHPSWIWPSRYDESGNPRYIRPPKARS